MSTARRNLTLLVIAASILWHAVSVLDHWRQGHRERHGRDFASYYYAVQVASDGGNPYDKRALGAASRQDETRKSVHPFFYPPPFVFATSWLSLFELRTGYRIWFWLDELFTLASLLVLWRWWGRLDDAVPVILAVCLGALTAIPNNHLMGQANTPVLWLVLTSLWMDRRERAVWAGALMGAACMLKMSPGLFVAWWMLQGRWTAAISACVSAVVYSLLSWPWVGPDAQWYFYTSVLPGFGSGNYNGLMVGIDLFGNHSIPNLYDAAFPNPARGDLSLSATARTLSSLTLVAMVGGLGWAFRKPPEDALAHAGQVGAITATMLLVPVFTYEHHLVWLIPSVVCAVVALARGRLDAVWTLPIALAVVFWAYDLADLKSMYGYVKSGFPATAFAIQEAKFASIVCIFAANVVVGRSHARPGDSE